MYRRPSRANGGAPVPAPMVVLQKGTIKIRPCFCRLVWSRRRGLDRRRGRNLWGGISRGFPSSQPMCPSICHNHHYRRWHGNSGGGALAAEAAAASAAVPGTAVIVAEEVPFLSKISDLGGRRFRNAVAD